MNLLAESALTYESFLRAYVKGLWTGVFNRVEFTSAAFDVITKEFFSAWARGAGKCGINTADLTPEELAARQGRINAEFGYLIGFASEIDANSKANGGKLEPFMARIPMWVNTLGSVEGQAMIMACANQKLMWIYGPTEHCTSCANYHGRVYRASAWRRYGIEPQSRSLACGGWRCQCRFEVTNLPVTPGRPPGMKG